MASFPKLRRLARVLFILLIVTIVLFVLLDDVIMPAYVEQGKTTRVPNVMGMTLDEAKKVIIQAGLQPKEAEYKQDKQYPEGTIALQNPLPGAEVKFERGVYLTISGGEALVVVPNLRGKSVRDATFNLERFGLKLGRVEYQPSDSLFENTVIALEIQADTRVRSGTAVNVIVSQGKTADRLAVPSVTLKTLTEAERILNGGGFNVGKVTYQVSLELLPNTVIEQYPRPGELAPRAARIDLIIAQKADKKSPFEN
jgi:serine/threonine-protein kinase